MEPKDLKTDVEFKTKMLKATWTYDFETYPYQWPEPKADISKLTLDEQADLIVKKLSTPPKPKRTTEDELMEIMSKAIAEEIDKEILEKLKKGIPK